MRITLSIIALIGGLLLVAPGFGEDGQPVQQPVMGQQPIQQPVGQQPQQPVTPQQPPKPLPRMIVVRVSQSQSGEELNGEVFTVDQAAPVTSEIAAQRINDQLNASSSFTLQRGELPQGAPAAVTREFNRGSESIGGADWGRRWYYYNPYNSLYSYGYYPYYYGNYGYYYNYNLYPYYYNYAYYGYPYRYYYYYNYYYPW